MPTAFIHHPDCALHDMGDGHPESPARLKAIEAHLREKGMMQHLVDVIAPMATREQLARVHDADHIDFITGRSPRSGLARLDADTAMNPHSLSAALHAAGAVVKAVDLVMDGTVTNAFCSVRPPGHHACRGRPMGFCLFNNVAVGAAHALETRGLARVAIVDFDVHHGNGTEDIFARDERVLMVSTFQHPFYPYSGPEGRSDRMVNIPLPAHSAGAEFRRAVDDFWMPALSAFAPQMIFVSAGFDAHRDDDMASLSFVEDDYAWVTGRIMDAAADTAHGRVVSSLEGGYDLQALARSVEVHLRKLGGG